MADKKISELDAITGANTAATDVFVVVDTSTGQTKKITREELNNAIERDVLDSIDIDTINGDFTVNGNINLGDSNKAIFGAGNDLQIYHDGTHSYVLDNGTGDLLLRGDNLRLQSASGENYLYALSNGATMLYNNNAQKLATTSTGIDVTGTVTADGLTVDGGVDAYLNNNVADFTIGDAGYLAINHSFRGGDYRINIAGTSADELRFLNGASQNLFRIAANGDISFFEDTGTTRKLYWDASEEALGIGTSSPNTVLHIKNTSGNNGLRIETASTDNGFIHFADAEDDNVGRVVYSHSDNSMQFVTNDAERMRITSTGLVGIGTSSPAQDLELNKNASNVNLNIRSSNSGSATLLFGDQSDASVASITQDNSNNALIFKNNNQQERMRITSDGSVGIGTDSPSYQTHIKGTGSAFRLGLESDGLIVGQAFITDNSGSPVYASISSGLGNLTFAADSGNSYASSYMDFQIDGSEKARLDASGNLLVGTTDTTLYNNSGSGNGGIALSMPAAGAGRIDVARAGNCYTANRLASDGNFFEFFKDGTQVGSIGVENSDRLYIDSGSGNTGIRFDGAAWIPRDNGSVTDGTVDLGSSGARFKDLRLGGTAYVGTSVGIGTSSPQSILQVRGVNPDVYITSDDTGQSDIYFGGSTSPTKGRIQYSDNADIMAFWVDSSERMRIDSSGSVLIGATSRTDPSSASKVIIKSNFLSEWGLSMISTQTSGAAAFIRFIYNSSTAVGSISSSATNVSYNTSSDQRLKENIADANDAGNKIDAIQVRQFDWKVDGSHQDYGMIAQELQNVAPEVVSGDADSEEMMGVDYSKLVPMLIKEIQSLRNRVSKLEGN